MRLVTWIIGLLVALAAVLFAISNRDTVSVSVWPLPFVIDIGLYAVGLICVLAGFLVGTLLSWVAAGKHRRRVRRQRSEIKRLEKDLDDTRRQLQAANKVAPSNLDEAA